MATSMSTTTKKRLSAPRGRLLILLALLILLSAVAVYVRTLPRRKENALRAASISELIALSKREPNNPRVFYHLGLRLQSVGQLPPARAAFERASQLDDEDEEAWLAWATAAGNLGSEQEAFAVLSTLTKNHPVSAQAHKALAAFYYAQEALPRAYEEALATTKFDPKDGAAWRLAGVSAIGLENYVNAEQAFRQAVALDPKDWRGLIGLGDALDRGERRREALDWYRKANAAAPNEPATTTAVGRLMFTLATAPSEVRAAREVLERAAAQNPAASHPQLWLGRAYIREGQWDKARQTLERAEQLAPRDYGIAYELQRVYTHQGDTVRAARESKRHETLHAYALEAYNLLARLHEAKGELDQQLRLQLSRLYASHNDYEKAAHEYKQLIRRAPQLEVAKQELADVERKLPQAGRPALSLAQTSSATSNVPLATLLSDGEAMLKQKRYAEAQTAFLTALQRDTNHVQAAEGLGLALAAQGRTDEAFKTLKKVLEIEPARPRAQFAVAQMYYNIGLPDEATHRMEKLVKQIPNEADYTHGLGMCYLSTERPQQAEQLLTRATALAPDNAAFWSDLASAEIKNERVGPAEAYYRKAIQLASADPDMNVRLAMFLMRYQVTPARQQEAGQLFEKALSVSPTHTEALLGMGQLQITQKNPQRAVTLLETLINANPDDRQAYFQLARAYDQLGNKERADYCRKVFRTVSEFQTDRDNTEEQVRLHLKDARLRIKLARLYTRGGQYAKAVNQYQMGVYLDPKNAQAKQELAALTARLQASGQMPDVMTFNNMVSASLKR